MTKFGLLDLVVRMIDKDQVGGDRKISILSNQFRLIQSFTEILFIKFNENIRSEYLDDRSKYPNMMRMMEIAMKSNSSFLLPYI